MGRCKRGTALYEYCVSEKKEWILEQFDYEKNFPLTPKDVAKSSDRKVWFRFPCGHVCRQRIADKTAKNSKGCPACLNRGTIGKSLLDEYPYYAEMFDAERNEISAGEVSRKNGKQYWWKCKRCGNSFQGKVSDVVGGHRVCGECTNQKRSFPEYCLAFYMKQIDENREINKVIEGYQFDMFLPKYQLAIEYDGYPWHDTESARRNDVKKDAICARLGIPLIRVRDSRLRPNERLTSHVWNIEYDGKFQFLNAISEQLYPYIGAPAMKLEINAARDMRDIKRGQYTMERKESLLACVPELARFLDQDERNGNPEFVCSASHKVYFWLRHPQYPDLKWTMSAHKMFARREPYPHRIKMCVKLLERYPELEVQVSKVGDKIREGTEFRLQCQCGDPFVKTYAALMGRGKVTMCKECLKQYRFRNLHRTSDFVTKP